MLDSAALRDVAQLALLLRDQGRSGDHLGIGQGAMRQQLCPLRHETDDVRQQPADHGILGQGRRPREFRPTTRAFGRLPGAIDQGPQHAALVIEPFLLHLQRRLALYLVARLGIGIDQAVGAAVLLQRLFGQRQRVTDDRPPGFPGTPPPHDMPRAGSPAPVEVGLRHGIHHVARQRLVGALVGDGDDAGIGIHARQAQALTHHLGRVGRGHHGQRDLLWPAVRGAERQRLDLHAAGLERDAVAAALHVTVGGGDREHRGVPVHQIGSGLRVVGDVQVPEQRTARGALWVGDRHAQAQRVHHVLHHAAAAEDLHLGFDGGRLGQGGQHVR